jgi:hypothetical protein
LDGGRCRLADLAPLVKVREAVAGLRLALRAELVAGSPGASQIALGEAGHAVQDLVWAPLALPHGREVVIVGDGPVVQTPWALLPDLASVTLGVAGSAAAILQARRRDPVISRQVSVVGLAGPGLHHAEEEVESISRLWNGCAHVLKGERANVAAAKAAMRCADLVHIAAHGIFRGDNPLLSAIQLADGSITGDELARATRTARLVVLSCCDSGMADPSGIGLSRLLTGGGATAVIASVSPVPDAGSVALMNKFHGRLVLGQSPAAALTSARQALGGPLVSPASAGFVCFGDGFGVLARSRMRR